MAWVLGLVEQLDFWSYCSESFASLMPDVNVNESRARISAASNLRSVDEIVEALDLAYCLHWNNRASADLSVLDVGPGIPTEKLKEIFEPFFTTKPQRMGMGLSIVRTIVEAHGGHLSVQNRPGRGAAFIIGIPLAASE